MSGKMNVLVVDDEREIRLSLKEVLEEMNYTVFLAENAAEGEKLYTKEINLVLLDIKLGADNGLDLLKVFKEKIPQIPIIMISGHGTVASAAKAFKFGAHEFIEKPLRLIHVKACVRNALESVLLKKKVLEQEEGKFPKPVYQSQEMTRLFSQVGKLASIKESVVILGPSGSGKELVACALHYKGKRADGPFIATNAASLPVNLAEDELFGHEKGAFTGATSRRTGALENAHKGTLFLDEIADLDLQVQAKLLRVLETGELTRLGSNEIVKIDVRIVAATHKNLQELVDKGDFRQDLWFRLCAFVLDVPPLSQRKDDIPLLAQSFLDKINMEMDTQKTISPEAFKYLETIDFPGNIRELKHLITRANVFSEGSEISVDDIEIAQGRGSVRMQQSSSNTSNSNALDEYSCLDFKTARTTFEKNFLTFCLEKNEGNITSTAASIGMAQSNLSRKLKELGIK